MLGFKNFLQQDSNRKQNFKMAVLGLAVLVATVAATLLTGYITTSKSSPPKNFGPEIVFQRQEDILIAQSSDPVEEWQYIGPRSQSNCNATIFDEFLGFGENFKTGNRLRLDFDRDHNRYYCFKAIGANRIASFRFYHVTDLVKPVIVFEIEGERLSAKLSAEADPQFYTKNWQYILLSHHQAACDQSAFERDSERVVSSQTVRLEDADHDQFYCFRLATKTQNHVYRVKHVPTKLSTKPAVEILEFSNRLHLIADQPVKQWQAAIIEADASCQTSVFEDGSPQTSRTGEGVVLLPPDNLELTYCFRVQNRNGVYNYQKYSRPADLARIQIETLPRSDGRLTLSAQTSASVDAWQIALVEDFVSCQDSHWADQTIVSYQTDITVGWVSDQPRIYCWRASVGRAPTYAAAALPSTSQTVLVYSDGSRLAASPLIEELDDWQYAAKTLSITNLDCRQADFQPLAEPRLVFAEDQIYCIRASDARSNLHYSRPVIAAGYAALKPSGQQVALANDLQLTALGRHVLYTTELRYHSSLQSLQNACAQRVSISCYSPDGQIIHLLKNAELTNHKNLKTYILQAARDHYLTEEQKALLAIQLRLAQQRDSDFWKKKLTTNFYNRHLFASEFQKSLYDLMVNQLTDTARLSAQTDFWVDYYYLFFK